MKKRIAQLSPLLAITLAGLLLCLRLLVTPGVVAFRLPLEWGFINWAHRYPLLLDHFTDAFRHGILYPRWLPQLMAGNGYPTFVFYQPGMFFFSLPFSLLLPPVLACKLAVLAALVLGGAGALQLARQWLPPLPATVAALLFLLNPYIIAALYVRAAYSELFAIMLCPWVLHALLRIRINTFRPALAFSLWLAALALSHPFVLIYFAGFLLLLAPALWWQAGRPPRLLTIYALCAALALALSAVYWLPALQLRHAVNYQGILFTYPGWYRPVTELLAANAGSTLLVTAGLALNWRRPLAWAVAAYGAFLLFLNTPASAPLWQYRIINLTQLPYRSFSADASLRLLGYILLLHALQQRARPLLKPAAAALPLAVLIGILVNPMAHPPESRPFSLVEFRNRLTDEDHAEYVKAARQRYNDESLSYDFLPREVDIKSLQKEIAYSNPLAWNDPQHAIEAELAPGSTLYHIRARAHAASPGTLYLRQFAFPGWRVQLNGADTAATPGEHGRITLQLPQPGNYTVDAWYEGPPHWLARNIAIIMIAGAAVLLLRRLTGARP